MLPMAPKAHVLAIELDWPATQRVSFTLLGARVFRLSGATTKPTLQAAPASLSPARRGRG